MRESDWAVVTLNVEKHSFLHESLDKIPLIKPANAKIVYQNLAIIPPPPAGDWETKLDTLI